MKKAIRLLVFLVLNCIVFIAIYRVLSWKDTTGEYLSSTQQLYATDENLMDVVFMGSSHCYCAVNPSRLWEDYGMPAFDMAISGADKESNYYSLVELLKTQSPKVVCIDLYGLLYEGYAVKGNEYRNLLAMEPSVNSSELIKAAASKEEQLDYLFRWPIIHTRYSELTKYDFEQYKPSVYGRGFAANYVVGWAARPSDAIECEWTSALTITNREWLDRLISLSEAEGFELCFFVAPFNATVQEQKVINSATDYVSQAGIEVLDCNKNWDKIGLDETTDFCDATHTNFWGAEKVTDYLGKYLARQYQFEDHRKDSRYYLWNDCLEYEEHSYAAYELDSIGDMSEYLEELRKTKDITYVLSLDGDYKSSTLQIQKELEKFGISKDAYELGGKWLFENGELIHYLESGSTDEYLYDFKNDTMCVKNVMNPSTDTEKLSGIRIGSQNYGTIFNGLNIVVYDDVMHKVISQRGFY